jgi:hypothetical protein
MTTIREGRSTITIFGGDLEWRQGLYPHVENLCGRCIWNVLTYKKEIVVVVVVVSGCSSSSGSCSSGCSSGSSSSITTKQFIIHE